MRMAAKIAAGGGTPRRSGPVLYLPSGPQGRGFLIFTLSRTETAMVDLAPALVRPILALQEARARRERLPAEACGWLSARQLVEAVAGRDAHLIPTEINTVRYYVSKINKAVRRAGVPALIQTRSMLGYRLREDVTVVDGNEARRPAKGGGGARGRRAPRTPRGSDVPGA